jgi:hypothetical protein
MTQQNILQNIHRAQRAAQQGRASDVVYLLATAHEQALELLDDLERLRRQLGRVERTNELPAFLQRQAD